MEEHAVFQSSKPSVLTDPATRQEEKDGQEGIACNLKSDRQFLKEHNFCKSFLLFVSSSTERLVQ